MNKNKFYLTTPIYYPNAKPHVGTLYSTLIADVIARWNKFQGKNVFLMTGTDEHGQKIETRAAAEGKPTKVFVDSMIAPFKEVFKLYEIDYNRFIRTTDADHTPAVYEMIKRMQAKGDIYKSYYTGLYCIPDETFIGLSSEIAKNDKGEVLCPTCKRPVSEVAEESYFFRLSAYQEPLLKFFEEHPNFIAPKERLNEVIAFVKAGLKDLCISRRSVKWGIPFPEDPEHTVYVWCDALTNYLTGVGFGAGRSPRTSGNEVGPLDSQNKKEFEEQFNFWWPADVHVLAKDIIRFHAVYWPAFLMSADLPLPKKLLVHGWILMGDQKMSKSLANAVDPLTLSEWYGVEAVRYYLIRQMAINQDGQFDLHDLENRINADLANNLGNLLNRTLTLANAHGFATVNAQAEWSEAEIALHDKCGEAFRSFWDEMNHYNFHIALANLWNFISDVNAYFHAQQPWVVAKQDKARFEVIISAVCHSLYAIGSMAWAVMPQKMEQLMASLGHSLSIASENNKAEELRKNLWNRSFTLKAPEQPLFPRQETRIPKTEKSMDSVAKGEVKPEVSVPTITIDEFVKVHLVTGTVNECTPVEGSSKLYKLMVDMGDYGQRQVLSGVAQYFTPDQLIGKQAVFVANLAPRKMMGLESHGMLLTAKEGNSLRIITPTEPVKNGTMLT